MQGPRPSQGPKGDINVTPLVDVVLVLLIIFMVITPMLQKGKEVVLPVADNPSKTTNVQEQVTISVRKDSTVWLETTQKTLPELEADLKDWFAKDPRKPVKVKGDIEANYGKVREVMKACNDAGFEKVGIVTKKRGEE